MLQVIRNKEHNIGHQFRYLEWYIRRGSKRNKKALLISKRICRLLYRKFEMGGIKKWLSFTGFRTV